MLVSAEILLIPALLKTFFLDIKMQTNDAWYNERAGEGTVVRNCVEKL